MRYTPGNSPSSYSAVGAASYAGPFEVVELKPTHKHGRECQTVYILHPRAGKMAFCYADNETGMDHMDKRYRIIDAYKMPTEEGG